MVSLAATPVMIGSATAPEPDPPLIVMVGRPVKPLPGEVTGIDST